MPIAIVGIGLRFPGAAEPATLHDLISSGRRMFAAIAGNGNGVADGARGPGGQSSLYGAVIEGWRAAEASAGGDELARRRAGVTDAHLLAGETASRALAELSGHPVPADRTSAIMSCTQDASMLDVTSWLCRQRGFGAPRVPPGAGACSLRAVTTACDLLSAGEADLALAGGVSLGLDREWLARQLRAGTLGGAAVRVYDARPTGTLPGEGCGVVALMRADEAAAAGLPSYAEIIGWHSDARGDAARHAYDRCGIDPADVQFIEGHGAATANADLVELSGLIDLLPRRGSGCALGAITANLGDTRAAAGVAGLIKGAIALAAGTIPPATGCVDPHHLLGKETAPFRLPRVAEPWAEATTQFAAVNTMGPGSDPVGVSTTHLVLRREPDLGRPAGRRRRAQPPSAADTAPLAAPVPAGPAVPPPAKPAIPSPRPPALRKLSDGQPGEPSRQAGRGAGTTVVALRGADREDLAAALDTIAIMASGLSAADMHDFAWQLATDLAGGDPGSPGPAGGGCVLRAAIVSGDPQQLAERARLAAHAARTARLAPPHAAHGCYLSDRASGRVVLLFGGLADTRESHAATLADSLRALEHMDRFGVSARVAVGYSMGEITALAWANSIAIAEAARLVAQRAEVLNACPRHTAMVRVAAGADAVRDFCLASGVEIAADEGPARQVIAGHAAGVRELARRARAAGLTADVLPARLGLHHAALRGTVPPMRVITGAMRFGPLRRRVVSTITGGELTPADDLAELVARQLVQTVRFGEAIALAADGADLIVQAGPDAALAAAAAGCTQVPVAVMPAVRPATTQPATPAVLAALFTAGAIDDLRPFLRAPTGQATGAKDGQRPA